MVTKPNMPIPPAPTGLKPNPTKIEPAELATSASQNPKYLADPATSKTDVVNKDRDAKFKLPEKVTAAQARDQSFKYGGGRSAGNRSLADNMVNKALEP